MQVKGLVYIVGLLVAFVTLCSAQTNRSAFFRISSPTNAVIINFDPNVSGTITWSNDVVGATNQLQRAYALYETSNWVDFVQLFSTAGVTGTERIIDFEPPEGMVFIPGGVFQMGDAVGDGNYTELPGHSVYVSGFYMSRYEVTKAQWDEVYGWATTNSYGFKWGGLGQGNDHPVHSVSWYDAVKWCNARSEKEGRVPCYTITNTVYRNGQDSQFPPDCDWTANGYRLPTEAEWEKAARGGLKGKRFPWGDTLTRSNATYFNISSTNTTTSGGSYAANGYELYDVTGNVWEWCWDRYSATYYATSSTSNPHGPALGSSRVRRGASWRQVEWSCRVACRADTFPSDPLDENGFRVCLGGD